MAGPQRPHRETGPRVVGRVPGQLAALRRAPQRGQRGVVLHDEAPPGAGRGRGQRTVRQVQVQRADDVQPGGVREQPELRPGAGIEVEQVVGARAGLTAEVQVEDAPVAQGTDQPLRQRRHRRVDRPLPGRGQPRPARPGAVLAPGAARAQRALPVGVAVEEPVAVGPRRQERLEQQPAARLRRARVQLPRLPRRAQHHRAPQPGPGRQQPGTAPLGHHREPQPLRPGDRLGGAVGDEGERVRHAHPGAQSGQFGLVRDFFGERPGPRGQQEGGGEPFPQPAHRDRPRVVHRDQHGGPADPRGDPVQHGGDVGGTGAGRRRRMQPAEEPGAAHRTGGAVGDQVHLHSRPAERAHRAQRSVVEGIPVDPQQNCGDPDVEQRHGDFPSDSSARARAGAGTSAPASVPASVEFLGGTSDAIFRRLSRCFSRSLPRSFSQRVARTSFGPVHPCERQRHPKAGTTVGETGIHMTECQ
ncbi:hypothetical protein B0E37_06269 [Streptomyces sp. MH192]|nr:hypothetical protein [Streptomyces sp. MH192]MCF0103619.1 hypothetical protein [Streptomyces sp. MH191]